MYGRTSSTYRHFNSKFYALPDSLKGQNTTEQLFSFSFSASHHGIRRLLHGWARFRQEKNTSLRRGYSQVPRIMASRSSHSHAEVCRHRVVASIRRSLSSAAPSLCRRSIRRIQPHCLLVTMRDSYASSPCRPHPSSRPPVLQFGAKELRLDFEPVPQSVSVPLQQTSSHSLPQTWAHYTTAHAERILDILPVDCLWTLWEAVLLNQSVSVFSDCPETCSAAVSLLASLIMPVHESCTCAHTLTTRSFRSDIRAL